jgi:hypothetical protein
MSIAADPHPVETPPEEENVELPVDVEPTMTFITPTGGRVINMPDGSCVFEFATPFHVYAVKLTREQAETYGKAVTQGAPSAIQPATAADLSRLPRIRG